METWFIVIIYTAKDGSIKRAVQSVSALNAYYAITIGWFDFESQGIETKSIDGIKAVREI